jgi:hypothetical protein
MIHLINRDRKIYDLEYRVADMLHEYQITGMIHIDTNSEGLSLEKVNFFKLLDYVCEKFSINKSKVHIHTYNVLETHSEYKINTRLSHCWYSMQPHIDKFYEYKEKQTELKTLCCFMGRINWCRLIFASWFYNNYNDKCLMSFNYNHTDVDKLCSDLTEINFYDSTCLEESVLFLKHCPILVDNLYYNKVVPYDEQWLNYLNPLNYYHKVFIDFVIETYLFGNTFFTTEKTLRPIIAKTPFIIFGPKNYLKNLRALGFQTFNRWWDESYDFCEGAHRVNETKKILAEIFSWKQEKMQQVLTEMESVLEHNKNLYLGMKVNDQK